MIRFLFALSFLIVSYSAIAQQIVVNKSSDVVVIRGKSYYLHTVAVGQTLYSICKAYGVDVDRVKELNEKHDNTLSLQEVLKIPYVEPYVKQDKNYYYHKVQKGETLYSIARKFDIKVRRILKENSTYNEIDPLPIDAVLRLPLKEINTAMINETVRIGERHAAVAENKTVPKEEKSVVVKKITEQPAKEVAKEEAHKPVKKTATESVKKAEVPVTGMAAEKPSDDDVTQVWTGHNRPVRVALLLPLYAKENIAANQSVIGMDSLGRAQGKSSGRILHKSEQFVYFYEGILMAVDSLRHRGMKIDLQVFDTERNVEKMHEIVQQLNTLQPDLIIGPVYGSVFKVMADNLQDKNIPIVYPLSSRSENFGEHANFLQVNPSFNTLVEEMSDWIAAQSGMANVISINLLKGADQHSLADATERKLFADRMQKVKGIHFVKWNFEEEQVTALKQILKPDRENIIILPTSREADVSKILPALSVYADQYRITVVGLPEWQTFTSVDHETYYKLNVKIFTPSYVDNYTVKAKHFADNYRKYFYSEPNTLTNKAYDMGLYFIELADKYRHKTLEVIASEEKEELFSRFKFVRMCDGCGMENRGLYIVNYGSDYQIKVEPLR